MKASTAVTHRVLSAVLTAALSALAFAQGTEGWAIVGAVLLGAAIVDVILLVVVAWFRWRHQDHRADHRA
ncbi:MAG TPA: hypothetical protein VFX21_00845 [Acidimicrobiia bacterium]|nr:hypothetical protein [Acidimicrobiia bacterium]